MDISKNSNMYQEYLQMADTPEGHDIKVPLLIKALHMTFKRFRIEDEEEQQVFGNFILRFSHWVVEQDEPIRLDPEDKKLNAIMEMYEYYQTAAAKLFAENP